MKISLKKKILDYIKSQYPNAVHKGELGRLAVNQWGFLNENMGRRCRELENEGYIMASYNEKREVSYKYIPQAMQPEQVELTPQDILNHALR